VSHSRDRLRAASATVTRLIKDDLGGRYTSPDAIETQFDVSVEAQFDGGNYDSSDRVTIQVTELRFK
jgi:hypothetical protein